MFGPRINRKTNLSPLCRSKLSFDRRFKTILNRRLEWTVGRHENFDSFRRWLAVHTLFDLVFAAWLERHAWPSAGGTSMLSLA